MLNILKEFLSHQVWTGVAGIITVLAFLLSVYPIADHQGVRTPEQIVHQDFRSGMAAPPDSNARIAAMEQALGAWQAERSPASAKGIADAYDALTAVDRSGFTPVQGALFQRLQAAYRIVNKTVGGPWVGARDQVPIFVAVSGEGGASTAATFTEKLQSNGFRVVASRDEAELIVELTCSLRRLGPAPLSDHLQSGVAEVVLNAHWAYDGSTFIQASHRGSGGGSTPQIAASDAYSDAANQLFRDFLAKMPPRES
ncbi:hypothetical protein [uncultured Thiodictyon sp.]|uniref:hypothetical protein n=1 Tax=uncultured Thiodictyon sp. TaxID=1846217 RepID=UPI0025D0AFBE|nr:hypothetical protein [uncultured Thiodictyon sp.]